VGTIWDGDLTQTADEVSSCWTFTVNILETGYTTDGMSIHRPVDSVKCSFVDAYVEMAYYNQYNWNFATAPSPPSGWPQGAKDAVTAWAATLPTPDGPDYIATCNVYIAKAVSGSNSDAVYLGTGFYEYLIPGTGKRTKQHGPRDWSLAAGFELNDAIMRIRCGAEEQEKRANIRSWHDRFAQAIVCGDENTSVTAFIGTATATHTYTFPTGEFPPGNPISGTIIIGGESSQLSIALGMAELPTTNTSYASITDLQWGGVECDLGLERITFWTDDGGATWDVSEDDPGGSYYAHLFADSDAITVQRVQAGDESLIASVNCQILGPIRYNLIAQRFAVGTDFDVLATEEEWSAYTGLNQYVDEDTYEPVYLGEGLSDYYTQVWWYSGADVDNRIKTGEYYFAFMFAGCEVKDSYLEAEHEDLSSEGDEDAPYGIDYSQTNKYGMVVLPSIASTLDSTEPYWPGSVDLSWSEISADIPPGESSRPTNWTGSGVAVNNTTNEWIVGGSGGTVSRTLVARWPYRFDYVAAGVPESGWFNTDLALWNKANCCLDEDDLPAAVTAVPVEDVVNYDNSSWVELSFATWPETAEGQTISATLTYYTVSITDPWYTCAEHRYMAPEGEWDYTATQGQITIDGTLSAAGAVLFDLGKLERSNTVKLQRVAAVSLAFPAGAAGTYEFADWRLVADAEVADDPVINFQAGISPWNFLEDFTGAGGTASGVACLNLDYGYEDKRGEQWGMAQTQYRQHCPESSASGDISEAKALSRMVNELNWQEQLTATYGTAAVAAAMVDADENCMGQGPFWWDTERGTGDALTGAGGIAVRNLVAVPYGTGPVPVTVNAYWTCGGRIHGLAYSGAGRSRGSGEGESGDGESYSIKAYRRLTSGGDWEVYGSCSPDQYGRFRTPPSPEKDYTYSVADNACNQSTRQYSIASASQRDLWDPHKALDKAGIMWRAAESGGAVYVHYAGAGKDPWVQVSNQPWSSGMTRPAITCCDDGSILVTATDNNGDMLIKRSRDWGNSWQAVTA
jgi:hypothetical protein